jgi:hypothetical protein
MFSVINKIHGSEKSKGNVGLNCQVNLITTFYKCCFHQQPKSNEKDWRFPENIYLVSEIDSSSKIVIRSSTTVSKMSKMSHSYHLKGKIVQLSSNVVR